MTERTDLVTDWSVQPRIIEVASPSAGINIQDLHDTLRSNTKQAGEGDLDNMDDDFLIDSAGKEDLGGGVLVGITATLQNAQLAFESRLTPAEEGTITNSDATGRLFEDSAALLITNGVDRGSVIINFSDESITEVLEVLTETTAITRVLRAGTLNQYTSADVYKIWNVIQCEIDGGNLVAIDDVDATISPVFPTAFTQIVRTSSSSATLQEQADIQYSSFGGGVTVDVTSLYAGTTFPVGTPRQPVNNLSDALTIANERGFGQFYIIGDVTVPIGPDYSNKRFVGESRTRTTITIPSAATVDNCEYSESTITGTLDGNSLIEQCAITTLNFVNGLVRDSELTAATIVLGGGAVATFVDCWDGGPGFTQPTIDMGGSGQDLNLVRFAGGVTLTNKTGAGDSAVIDFASGAVTIDDSVDAGDVVLRGAGNWTNEETYAGNANIANSLLDGDNLREIWKLLGLDINDTITITPAGVTSSQGSFVIGFTGDGISSTVMNRSA